MGVDTVSIWQQQSNALASRALIAFVLAGTSASWAAPGPGKARDVLPRLEERRDRVRTLYHKTKTVVTGKDKQPVRSVTLETWENRDKDARQFRTTTTAVAAGDAKAKPVVSHTVSDGKTTWREVARGDTIMVIKSKANSDSSSLTDLLKAGQSKIKGREETDGERCTVVETTTMNRSGEQTNTYWISESYGLILKSHTMMRDGSVSVMTTIALKVNEPLSGANFTYEPPEGATILDTSALGAPQPSP